MSQAAERERFYPVRMWPKDLGVGLVVLLALGLGLLLCYQVEGASREFRDQDSPFRISYPASWVGAEAPEDGLLRVEDPRTDSAFKTTLTVESRLLDPAAPPTLQTLVDQRVAEQGALTAYRLLSNADATVDGARGARIDYGYVVQPIDAPRRASLPVVVQAREYVVVVQDRVYYIAVAAPQHEYEEAQARFERIVERVNVQ